MTAPKLSIHGRLTELADATRCRLLFALEEHELTVGELCQALQLPQSTVSRHLRILSDEGWVASRADGASRWYRMSQGLDFEALSLWSLVRRPLSASESAQQDLVRVESVIAQRRSRSAAFFRDAAVEWDAMRTSMFGARADLSAALALLDPAMIVGDLGCGTGSLVASLAPHVAHVHAIDASTEMLDAARSRLAGARNVTITESPLETLPLIDATLDAAIMLLVLHHVAQPVRVLSEARRVLKPGGRLLVADMQSHTRDEYRQQMGHVWLGFDEGPLREWSLEAGFRNHRYVPLPTDAEATGPALFTMVMW
jgi:ArsR family transcriptional regulator